MSLSGHANYLIINGYDDKSNQSNSISKQLLFINLFKWTIYL